MDQVPEHSVVASHEGLDQVTEHSVGASDEGLDQVTEHSVVASDEGLDQVPEHSVVASHEGLDQVPEHSAVASHEGLDQVPEHSVGASESQKESQKEQAVVKKCVVEIEWLKWETLDLFQNRMCHVKLCPLSSHKLKMHLAKNCSVVLTQLSSKEIRKYSCISDIKKNHTNKNLLQESVVEKKPIKMRSNFKQKKSVTLDLIFKCTKCNKCFATQNGQYKHYRTHLLGKYVCTICKKRFQYPKNLVDHKATHNPKLLVKCTVPGCGKKYTTVGSLKYHVRTHDGYHFKCTLCTFKAATQQNLK